MSSHLRCRLELLAPLDDPTEMVCSNGLIGVEDEDDGVCCEAQCGTCGGRGCAGRPGGRARWFLPLFVLSSGIAHLSRSIKFMFVRDVETGITIAGTEASTNRLATVCRENVDYCLSNVGRFGEQ